MVRHLLLQSLLLQLHPLQELLVCIFLADLVPDEGVEMPFELSLTLVVFEEVGKLPISLANCFCGLIVSETVPSGLGNGYPS